MTGSVAATALVVVDMQVAFVRGTSASPQMLTVSPAVKAQLAAAREAGALVVFLQNDGAEGAPDEPGTDGWRLVLEPGPGEVVVRKREDSGFEGTELGRVLEECQIRVLSVCGVMSEMCVAATARDAMAQGYRVVLAHDSHGTYDVPAFADGEPGVPADQAARAAEWSLGDTILIPACASDVGFAASEAGAPASEG